MRNVKTFRKSQTIPFFAKNNFRGEERTKRFFKLYDEVNDDEQEEVKIEEGKTII